MRVLIAWELGGNWGHLTRDLPIALALRARGHQVTLAVRDLAMAEALLAPNDLPFFQAPLLPPPAQVRPAPVNYADMLLAHGYGNSQALRAVLRGWTGLFDLLLPDVVVTDFAPFAALAARIAEAPIVAVGTGFEIPPAIHPWPSIRPWEPIADERLRAADAQFLHAINEALDEFGGPRIADLREIVRGQTNLIVGTAELDPFAPREGVRYVGPIHSVPADRVKVSWPSAIRPRLFGYLNRRTAGLKALLDTLQSRGVSILCVPGAEFPANTQGRCQLWRQAVELDSVLPEADAVITNGSAATTLQALLAGVPVLVLPQFVEHQLTARCIEALGVGLAASVNPSESQLAHLVERLTSEPAFRSHTREFAARHAHRSVAEATQEVLFAIEAMHRPVRTL